MGDRQEPIGQPIGDYLLKRQLGRGTFGSVYLAEHRHNQSQVAMKVLQFHLAGRDEFREFLNEARAIRLHHPSIVPILDFGLSRTDQPFLVMEYVDGGTLRARYPQGAQLPIAIIATYIQQIASALQYAHNRRIIHRDVKPANLLQRRDSTVLLSDFGIAKIIEQSSVVSQKTTAGTPAYTAPEQSQGRPEAGSDQYALGVVVYEWLAGRRPFKGGPFDVLAQHRMDTPPPVHMFRLDISPQMEKVVMQALAKKPEERFASINVFAQTFYNEGQIALNGRKISLHSSGNRRKGLYWGR